MLTAIAFMFTATAASAQPQPARIADQYATWSVFLLPYLEQDALYRTWDLTRKYYDQTTFDYKAQILTYYCPARRGPPQLCQIPEDDATSTMFGSLGDYAVAAGDAALNALFVEKARAWYLADRDAPAWEPSGDEFLSATLMEAECLRRLLPPAEFAPWLAAFLPRAAQRQPEARPHLVEDQQGPARLAQCLEPGQEALARGLEGRRLEDHAGGVVIQGVGHRVQVVVRDGVGEGRDVLGHAGVAIGDADVPVVPAVVPAAEHLFAPRERARQPHRRGGDVAAVLGEAHALGPRHDVAQALGGPLPIKRPLANLKVRPQVGHQEGFDLRRFGSRLAQ